MKHGKLAVKSALTILPFILLLFSSTSIAQNQAYQDFFFAVCGGATTGDLAARCASTPSGAGNISGDSENSLNPSQSLSAQSSTIGQAAIADPDSAYKTEINESFSLLVNGRIGSFELERTPGNDAERAYEGDTQGFDIGFDYRFASDSVIGLFVSMESFEQEFGRLLPNGSPFVPQDGAGTTESDSLGLTLFASHYFNDALFFEGSAGFKNTDYEFTRTVVFQESTRTVPQVNVNTLGETDGNQIYVSAGLAYGLGSDAFNFTPHFRLELIQTEIDGFTEIDQSNSGLNMNVELDDRSSFTSNLGFTSSYAISTSWGVIVPQARVEWEKEFDQDAQQISTSFALDANQNELILTGDNPDEDYYRYGLSLSMVTQGGFIGFFDYEAIAGYDDLDQNRFTLGIRLEL